MNCANHIEVPAAAYCRTCGKALCANCTRDVRGVIYCEECIAARLNDPAYGPGRASRWNRDSVCQCRWIPARVRDWRPSWGSSLALARCITANSAKDSCTYWSSPL